MRWGGVPDFSRTARAGRTDAFESSPIRLSVAAVSLIVVARRVSPSRRPVDSDARRALRRARVRDHQERTTGKLQNRERARELELVCYSKEMFSLRAI